MTIEIPKSIEINSAISFSVESNRVTVSEIDASKEAPFFYQITVKDWQEIVKFISKENGKKSR